MILCRRARLATALACLCFSIPSAAVAQQPAPPAQDKEKAKPPEAAKPPENPQPNKQNPFEAVPLSSTIISFQQSVMDGGDKKPQLLSLMRIWDVILAASHAGMR